MPGTIKNSISQNEYMIIEVFFSNYPKIKDKNLDDCIAALPAFMGFEHIPLPCQCLLKISRQEINYSKKGLPLLSETISCQTSHCRR